MHRDVILPCGGLQIVFWREGDRMRHRVEVERDGGFETVATSQEGSPNDDWPPSPPFQSLHVEHRSADCQVAFLVGMAGASHWSASVAVDRALGRAEFDIACRVAAQVDASPGRLGSHYELGRSREKAPLQLTSTIGTLEQTGDALAIYPAPPTPPLPATVRWQYSIALAQNT